MMKQFKTLMASLIIALPFFIDQATGQENVSVTAARVMAPLMKGETASPFTCIRIHVPQGHTFRLSGINCSLDTLAVDAVDSLAVASTGAEARISAPILETASIGITTSVAYIPFELDVPPGLSYLWVKARIREDANIDQSVVINTVSLQGENGVSYAIPQGEVPTAMRMGIALRKPWDDDVHTYRIPGLVTTHTGSLIAVYDIRYEHSGDLPANIDVGMSRSTDGGHTWEPMKIIMDMGEPHANNGVGDPSILFDPATNTIWVAALWSKGNRSIAGSKPGLSPDTTGQFMLTYSKDDGLTWSEPFSITPQVKNPTWHLYFNGPGAGIVMQDGTLVFPSQYWDETTSPSKVGIPHSSIVYSKDHGKTWESGIGAKSNTTEAQVVETTPGTLMLNMRDNRGRFRSIATTTDMGNTWTEHPTSYSALPDPVCQAGFIKALVNIDGQLKDVLFFSNVNSKAHRVDMTIKASLDNGETWLPSHELLIDGRDGYGYSSITKIDDDTLGLVYEGIRSLYFVRIPVADIVK